MIYSNFVELYSLMLQAKFQNQRPSGSEEEDLQCFFTIYRHSGHLGNMTWTIYISFHSPLLTMLRIKFGFDWQSGFTEEDL